MKDPRISQLARQLVRYSTNIKKGEKVMLHLCDVPDELGIALVREVRARKAVPVIKVEHGLLTRELLLGATDEQYKLIAKHQLAEMKDMDAYIAIRGSHNICEASDVPAARMKTMMNHMRKVMNHRVDHTKWCVLRWPHPAMAQQAGMSTEAFENFYFDVCLHDYKSMLPAMRALKRLMEKTDQVHIKNKGTDLRFSIKDIPAIVCGGNYNIPDGEVFTAPVKTSVEGHITHNAPPSIRVSHSIISTWNSNREKSLRQTPAPRPKSLTRSSMPILEHAISASSHSAFILASRSRCVTSSLMKKSPGRSTSLLARLTRKRTTATARKCTGTWSPFSARTTEGARFILMANSFAKTASSYPSRSPG